MSVPMDSWEMTGSLIFIFLLLTLYEIATFQEMRVKKDSTIIKSNITQDQGWKGIEDIFGEEEMTSDIRIVDMARKI